MSYSIAIDGPAGAGKSTIAKMIAKKRSLIYVDTGAMYRAMALHLIRKGIKPEESERISAECENADITIRYENNEQVVYLNGENVNAYLRTEEVGNMASKSSVNPDVRKKLVSLQQKLAATAEVIMDGRDIGTCVLPNADVKIYLTASTTVRAKRRYDELLAKGETPDFDSIEEDIKERDYRDMNREISPLKQAEDAVLVDTSDMNIEQVVNRIIEIADEKGKMRMEVKLATTAGFCFGVKRAVETVYEQIEKEEPIYTYGPIIHNEEVVGDLEKKGVKVLNTPEDIRQVEKGTIIIRSHGVAKEICDLIQEKELNCVDATCPFVKRIHKTVEKESAEGTRIVIVGNAGHPEVEGIIGWCKNGADVVETEDEAKKFKAESDEKICIVSQTTFNNNKFQYIVEIFQKKGYNVSVVNTICNATQERQAEAKKLASQADVMIVIGGRHSSNTRKLYEICCKECADTHYIQTLDDLHLTLPKSVRLVGITAGASTPNNIIEEVQNYVRINF